MQRTTGRIATLALACVLLLSLGGSYALAQQQQQPTDTADRAQVAPKKAKADNKERHKYKGGAISAVSGNQVSFKGADGKDRKFTLDSETRVKANGKQGSAGDLKAGMKATVRTVEHKDSGGSEKVAKVRAHTPKKDR
jgi:hypothetical protein